MPTDRLAALVDEYADLERQLADPAVHTDAQRARALGRRYADLGPVVAVVRELNRVRGDLAAARELGAEDRSFAAEATRLADELPALEDRLRTLLLPRDPYDDKDVILEVKA